MTLPRIAGNPVEKVIAESEAHMAMVRSEVRKRRQWASIRADVLQEWAKGQNINLPDLIEPKPESNTKAIAEVVGLWILTGVVAVTLGFVFHWLAATLAIEGVASFGAAALITMIVTTKTPEPLPALLTLDDPWLGALQKYFEPSFDGNVRDVAYSGRDASKRRHFAIWIGTNSPPPGNETPKF